MKNEWQEKNKIINPRMSGYNDRKMAKWQGLILSEHSEAMNQSKEKNKKINDQKEKQSLENISRRDNCEASRDDQINYLRVDSRYRFQIRPHR